MRQRRRLTTIMAAIGLLTATLSGVAGSAQANAPGRHHDDHHPRTPSTSARELTRGGQVQRIISDAFLIGHPYRGDFPDPSLLRVGRYFYAYSTTAAGRNLPITRSRDLVHWYPNRKHKGGWYNDGLNQFPRWASTYQEGRHQRGTLWAPSVARLGPHHYILAYATRYRSKTYKMCISTATASQPYGPFRDTSRRPLLCPPAYGAIDPQFVYGLGGTLSLVWKRDQSAHYGSLLASYRMRRNARGFKPSGPRGALLAPALSWEQPRVENPSMIHYAGLYYLFYSAGSYSDSSYATGYAVCSSMHGPCRRVSTQPLLHTSGKVSGTGGAMAFVDRHRRLHLAYAAWDRGATGYQGNPSCMKQATGCHQRRMHIATLVANQRTGLLAVTSYGDGR